MMYVLIVRTIWSKLQLRLYLQLLIRLPPNPFLSVACLKMPQLMTSHEREGSFDMLTIAIYQSYSLLRSSLCKIIKILITSTTIGGAASFYYRAKIQHITAKIYSSRGQQCYQLCLFQFI